MGNRVTSFFNELGQGLKMVWSETQSQFIRPVLGDNLSDRLGIKKPTGDYYKDQIGTLILANGGVVEEPVKEINTQAQLIELIRDFPEEAAKSGLSVELVKQEAKKLALGGRHQMTGYAHGGVFQPNKINDNVF
jgi:hypothetical protein